MEIFLDDEDGDNPDAMDIEVKVRILVEELIHLGYDQVIADIVDDAGLDDEPYQGFESH